MAEETTSTTSSSKTARNGKWKASQAGESQSGESMDTAMDSAQTAFSGVSEKASEYMDSATSYMKSFDANPLAFVRENPVRAAIGGVVIGLILGAAIGRRSITK